MIIIGKYTVHHETIYAESDNLSYEYAIIEIKDELESITGDIVDINDIQFYESRPLRVTVTTKYSFE